MKKNLPTIISLFKKQYATNQSYVAINENPLKSQLTDEDISAIYESPQIFFQASKSRIVLSTWIIDELRNIFEAYNFADIDITTDAYEKIRAHFKTTAFSKKRFLELLNCENKNSLSYNDFIDIETQIISVFNKEVAEEDKHPVITHIKIKTKKEPTNIFSTFFTIIEDAKTKEVLLERANKVTLEEIGKRLKVTRERARQIEIKPKNAIARWLELETESFKNTLCENNVVNSKKAVNQLTPEGYEILKYAIDSFAKDKNLAWTYIKETDTVIYDKNKDFYNIIDGQMQSIEETQNVVDAFVDVLTKNGFEFVNAKFITEFLSYRNYTIFDNSAHFGKMTIAKAMSLTAEDFKAEGIHITDKASLKSFTDAIATKYSIKVKPDKALSTRIQDILILVDKATYGPESSINIDSSILKEIDKYISTMDNERISYQSLFETFKTKLEKHSNITNQYFLHGTLKYFEGKYDYQCLRYYICKNEVVDTKSQSYFSKLSELLLENGGIMSREDIIKAIPEWNEMYIRYALNYYPEVVQWDKDTYINLKSIKISKEIKNNIESILGKLLDNKYKYTSSYLLFDMVSNEMEDFLKANNIDNEKKLYSLIQYLYMDTYKFRRPHILNNEKIKDTFSTDDLVKLIAGKSSIINKKELIEELVKYYGNKNSSLNLSLQRVLTKYVRIGQYLYIKEDKFILDNEIISKIKTFIEDNLIQDTILLPSKIDDFSDLPKIFNTKWTPWLLVGVVDKYIPEYKKVYNDTNIFIHALTPIVRANSDLNTKYDIAKWLIRNDYIGDSNDKESVNSYIKNTNIFTSKFDLDKILEG